MDDLKRILDPYKEGVRRAVVTESGLVRDMKHDPGKEECDVLSEVCRIVFEAETRDVRELLERAYVHNIEAAWNALFDDVRLGLVIPHVDMFVTNIMINMHHTTSAKHMYVSGKMIVSYAQQADIQKIRDPFDASVVVKNLESLSTDALYPDLVEVYQQVMAVTIPPIDDVADIIMNTPSSCAFFTKHPHVDHLCTMFPALLTVLADAADAVPVTQRQPYMVMLALMTRQGHRLEAQRTVALETLKGLRSTKFHLNIAASSAIVAGSQKNQDPAIVSLCVLIETLCSVIQKSCNIDTVEVM